MTTSVKAFGIGLSERPDRLMNLRREITRLGLPFEVIVGDRPFERGPFRNTGERGCYESHLAVLKAGLAQNLDVVIVCEDDVWISRLTRRVLGEVLTHLSGIDWTTLYLGYPDGFAPSTSATLRPVSKHLRTLEAWEVLCAHFYAVSSAALPTLIEELEQRRAGETCITVDGALNEFRHSRGLRPLVSIPNLGRQMPSVSSISIDPLAPSRHSRVMQNRALRWLIPIRKVLVRIRFEFAAAMGLVAPGLIYRRRTVGLESQC